MRTKTSIIDKGHSLSFLNTKINSLEHANNKLKIKVAEQTKHITGLLKKIEKLEDDLDDAIQSRHDYIMER